MMNNDILLFIIVGVTFILSVIALIQTLINSSKISAFTDYADDGDLMSAVREYYDKVDELALTISNSEDAVINDRLSNCESDINFAIRKIGIVNFDAYDDTRGQLSFALTLLNNYNDGIILTSLYGHNSCNTYVRRIVDGKADIKLLDEERESLSNAIINEKKVEEDA